MISDILSQMVEDIDSYLSHPATKDYVGELRERIVQLRDEADEIRIILDTPPKS